MACRITEVRRGVCLYAFVLAVLACGAGPGREEASASGATVFRSERPADVLPASGPYPVRVAVLGGAAIESGRVSFELLAADGRRRGSGQRELAPEPGGEWSAGIPGQPAGTEIAYHFEMRTAGGARLRHPARAAASYRFRVLPMRVEPLAVPRRVGEGPLRVRVSGASAPRGVLVGRRTGGGEVRVPMKVVPEKDGSFLLESSLPALERGQALDFYLEVRDRDREVRWPEGAPDFTVSIKRSLLKVSPVAWGEGRILDVAPGDGGAWLALDGGGVRQTAGEVWGMGRGRRGLPSAIVRHVEADAPSGRVFAGTDRGLVAIDVSTGTPVAFLPVGREADPVVVSPLDGSLLFQLRAQSPLGEGAEASQYRFQRGRLVPWHPRGGPVEWTAGAFDRVEGCALFGGLGSEAGSEAGSTRALLLHRICGEAEEVWRVPALPGALASARLLGVAALAREPGSGSLAVAVIAEVTEVVQGGAPRRFYGLYRLDEERQTLAPLGEAPFPAEVTGLAADERKGQLLIGTTGQGVLAWRQGKLSSWAGDPRVARVTALEMDPARDALWVGTAQGLFRLGGDGAVESASGPPPEPGLPPDALPMEVHPGGGRLLFSSHREGLAELVRRPDGSWRVDRRWLPGREIPEGNYGQAAYGADGGILAILRSRGLLRIGKERPLAGPHVLQLLPVRSGAVWAVLGSTPFDQAVKHNVQVIEGDRVAASFALADRRAGAVSDMLEVPERGAVWAATGMGVLELRRDGSSVRISQYATAALARGGKAIGAVGSTVERWNGERFEAVLFRVDHPRVAGGYVPGHPVDLAIDSAGRWFLLYSNGVVVLLDAGGSFLGLLDAEDGIPSTSRRLIVVPEAVPEAGQVLVGSSREGTVALGF